MDRLNLLLEKLYETNGLFPETQKFLARKGLTSVKELDTQGILDLQNHLKMLAGEFQI